MEHDNDIDELKSLLSFKHENHIFFPESETDIDHLLTLLQGFWLLSYCKIAGRGIDKPAGTCYNGAYGIGWSQELSQGTQTRWGKAIHDSGAPNNCFSTL